LNPRGSRPGHPSSRSALITGYIVNEHRRELQEDECEQSGQTSICETHQENRRQNEYQTDAPPATTIRLMAIPPATPSVTAHKLRATCCQVDSISCASAVAPMRLYTTTVALVSERCDRVVGLHVRVNADHDHHCPLPVSHLRWAARWTRLGWGLLATSPIRSRGAGLGTRRQGGDS